MDGIFDLMIDYLKKIVEPRGKGDMLDKISLLPWKGYAIVKRALAFFKERGVRKTNMLSGEKKSPGIRIQYNSDFYRNHIIEHILPFWEKYSIDHRYGGFITHLDRRGRIYDDTTKLSAMQARMIYAFSVGYDIQPNLNYLNIAKQGVKFLIENLWDHEFGGWYWSVYRDGRVKDTEKQLWAQAYVLLSLLEYYRVTRDEFTFKYVNKTHELLDQYGWDKQYLGYYEYYHRNWVVKSSKKTICVQLDLLAAIMSLYYVAGEDVYFNRLKQIADIIVMRMCDKKYGCVMEKFYRNWLYNPIATKDKIQFGHNLKAAWLLLEMYRLTKDQAYYTCAKRLIDYCIKYGWDTRNYGFYQHAYRNGILASSEKLWWPECEGIPALLLMHSLTRDSLYHDYFTRLTDFSFTYFFDGDYGEWFTSCHDDGTVKDENKGGDYKAAFHTVQACFYAYRYLQEKNRSSK